MTDQDPALWLMYLNTSEKIIRNHLEKMCRDPELLKDVVQETMTELVYVTVGYPTETVLPNLGRIEAMAEITLRRLRRRQQQFLPLEYAYNIPEEKNRIRDLENEEYLSELLRQIPEEQARAIYASKVKGLDYWEIAEEEGVPIGTIKSRVHNGMIRLKELTRKAKPIENGQEGED